ncbi:MAG: ANTAR domain-containing protein [Clostridia bacterium]|nr:ANTAR domain-containing protein [Clostridia bacterium]
MSLTERIYSVLLVSASEKLNDSLRELLPESRYFPVTTVASISAAKRAMLEYAFDLVLINAPLPDDIGTRFAIDVCNEKSTVAMMLVRNEVYHEIYEKAALRGVFILPKPTSRPTLTQALDWLVIARERLRCSEQKTVSVEEKMAEIRIVNRAKWVLIEHMNMTEEDAHKYIEKTAMDQCVSKRAIAESILKTYG